MTDTDIFQTEDGRQILFFLQDDLDALERKTEFPYGLRRGGERVPFSLPTWHPRADLLGQQFSTPTARTRYIATMRACGLIPQTPIEDRIHLHIDRFEAQNIDAEFDREMKLFFISRHRPDAQELTSRFQGGDHERAWIERQAEIAERRRKQMEFMRSSQWYLQGRLIRPTRGRQSGHQKPSRKALSYFKDLAAIGRIDGRTSQEEIFKLIADELAVWGTRVTPDGIRKLSGISWHDEILKIGAANQAQEQPTSTLSILEFPGSR